jgi:hypothetical protein
MTATIINNKTHTKVKLLGDIRWCYLDEFGRKDHITLKTESSKLITRTAQYYQIVAGEVKIYITYKGDGVLVTEDYILDD